MDLVCLLADKSIEAAIDGLLRRPESLGIRSIEFETVVHPRRDPGCFHYAGELLGGYVTRADHALIVLDSAWAGAPASTGAGLESLLEEALQSISTSQWAKAVVIEPELEAWVFKDSPHVATALGWPSTFADLRVTLEGEGLWSAGSLKPADPKAAVDWILRRAKRPRSSSMYRELASRVSLRGCEDPAFARLTGLLRGWFAQDNFDS